MKFKITISEVPEGPVGANAPQKIVYEQIIEGLNIREVILTANTDSPVAAKPVV